MSASLETIAYYDRNASGFAGDTANVEFGAIQRAFTAMLPADGRILDLGCGSGRDTLAFLRAGFKVDAVDGSVELARIAGAATGVAVECALFEDHDPRGPYDGIWACSSLLHVERAALPKTISKYAAALKPRGTFYMSFKLGGFEGMRNGRWFTDMDEPRFRELIGKVACLDIARIEVTADVRPGRGSERWLNAWCVKRA